MTQEPKQHLESASEAEETLRLLARLTPPPGLEERVQRRIAQAESMSVRRSFWGLWRPAHRIQFAAAALLLLAVGGSRWSVYRHRDQFAAHPEAQPRAGAAPAPAAPRVASAGSFGVASTARVPSSLTPIHVPPAKRKKPVAGRPLAKPSPRKPADSASPSPSTP